MTAFVICVGSSLLSKTADVTDTRFLKISIKVVISTVVRRNCLGRSLVFTVCTMYHHLTVIVKHSHMK